MQKNKIQEEKKMKKFLALLLAATMALGLLVGCGAEKS
jgi:hypothetical protein